MYILTFFLKKSSGGLCVLMYHFFIAKMSQWAISLESTADIQYRGFFSPSLKQYEHSFCSSERSHPLNMGRSPHCVCVCVRVHVSVNALESFQSWVDVLGMVLSHTNSCVTSSFLSLLRRHGDSDSNAGKTLRLCYVLCYCFFFQHGQGVVLPLFMSTLVIQRKAI